MRPETTNRQRHPAAKSAPRSALSQQLAECRVPRPLRNDHRTRTNPIDRAVAAGWTKGPSIVTNDILGTMPRSQNPASKIDHAVSNGIDLYSGGELSTPPSQQPTERV